MWLTRSCDSFSQLRRPLFSHSTLPQNWSRVTCETIGAWSNARRVPNKIFFKKIDKLHKKQKTIPTSQPLMDHWVVGPCLLSHISGVHCFSDFSHDLGTLPESYLKPCEEIQHGQDLKIESANKFQHCLQSLFSNQDSPIHALCSNVFFPRTWHSLHKVTFFCTVPLPEGVQHLKWTQSSFQRDICAEFLWRGKRSYGRTLSTYFQWLLIVVFLKECAVQVYAKLPW